MRASERRVPQVNRTHRNLQGVEVTARERVSSGVGRSFYVTEICSEFGDVGKMSEFPWGVDRVDRGYSRCEWIMVCKNTKLATFEESPELLDSEVHCQQLPADGVVPLLSAI